jgi:hypothetical protein
MLHYEINYPQKLWISQGLTNLEGNSRPRLEVDLLFFAQETALLIQGLVCQPIAVLIPVSFARLLNHLKRLT